jgi:hypothetical protein
MLPPRRNLPKPSVGAVAGPAFHLGSSVHADGFLKVYEIAETGPKMALPVQRFFA